MYVRDKLPPNAIVFTMMHSGSIRFYSHHTTVRWDVMDADWLDRAVTFLRDRGYHSYLVLDNFERPQFQKRFSGHSSLAELSWTPITTLPGATMTAIYDLSPTAGH
jgi:hypothetical protein